MRDRLPHIWPLRRAIVGGALGLMALVAVGGAFVWPGSPWTSSPQPAALTSPPTQTSVLVGDPNAVEAQAQTSEPVDTAAASPFAPLAQAPAEAPARTTPIEYTVGEGDVLWQVADHFQLRSETLLWTNDLDDPDLLLIGQKLLIPPSDGVLYTVRPGDSVATVADRYGLDVQAIVRSNGLGDADQIVAGADIFLPGGRPLARVPQVTNGAADTAQPATPDAELATAASGAAVALPDNIDALLASGWLQTQHVTDLYKSADASSARLHGLPGSARLERLDGFRNGRVEVRDPGDGRTRQAMTGWVNARELDVGRAPAPRDLPKAYPQDTSMDISHVFAPYRSQLDGSPYAEANCGPTAIGMALDAFGISVPSRALRAAALDAQHMYGNGVGTLITALAQVVEQQGLSALDLRQPDGSLHRWSLDDLRAHIRAGHPIVVQVRYRSLPGRGGVAYYGDHYILVTGEVGDSFLYNDPIDIDGLGWDRIMSGSVLRTAMNASAGGYAYAAFAVSR